MKKLKMTILWIILNYQINMYSKIISYFETNIYTLHRLYINFLHNEYKNKIKSNFALTWLFIWAMYLILLKLYDERRRYTSSGYTSMKNSTKSYLFWGFLITSSVILKISRGKILKFPIKIWVGTFFQTNKYKLLNRKYCIFTRVIQKIRGQCRSPSNYLTEIQNQFIILCKNIYSMSVWIFIAIGQMDLILINFKTNMFCTHGAIVRSEI
jgi:hypothetical protein